MSRHPRRRDYEPPGARAYWARRKQEQGLAYVARGGRWESYWEQLAGISRYIDYLPTQGSVLDFGCGPARFREALEDHGLEWFGWDLLPEFCTVAWPFGAESFDCAVAIFVFQHIVDASAHNLAVRSVYNALRPGGCLLVVDHDADKTTVFQAHMEPRGPNAFKHVGWSGLTMLEPYDGHWVGLWRK